MCVRRKNNINKWHQQPLQEVKRQIYDMAFITIAHCSLVKCPIDTRIGDANKQEQTIVVPISQSYGKLLLCLHNVLHIYVYMIMFTKINH